MAGLAAWALIVYFLTTEDLPGRLLEAFGINRGHPVMWQVTQALFWSSLTAAAYQIWIRLPERPRSDRSLAALAGLAGFFQVALLTIAGLAIGFGESPYNHRLLPMAANLLYAGSILVAIEMSRACIVAVFAPRRPTMTLAAATVFFAFLTLPHAKIWSIDGAETLMSAAGELVLPALSAGLLASYLVMVGGPLASIAYGAVLIAYEWLAPILPNLEWPVTAFVGTMAPLLGLWIVLQWSEPESLESTGAAEVPGADRRRRTGWIGVAFVSVTLVWFATGLFGIQPMIVSGPSMNPALEVGDVVLIADAAPEDIEVGDIIRFRQGELSIIHRVVEIDDGGPHTVFITRGDNNNTDDPPVLEGNLEGRVILRIPNAGWPSIWLKRLLGG